MREYRFSGLLPGQRALAALSALTGLAAGLLLCVGLAHAAPAGGLTVLLADDAAPHLEFAGRLRDGQPPDGDFNLVQLTGADPARDDAVAGRAVASAEPKVTVAVGLAASRVALDRPGPEPLVLAMLSRLDYQSLKPQLAMRQSDRPVGVLLREPTMADQLALIDAILPQKRRLGVIATTESEPAVNELQRAAQGWDLQVEYAPDAKSLAAALRLLVGRSDALLVLPDMVNDSQAGTLAVLRAGASAGLPVFGTSEGLVRSGGLAAAVSTPDQMARQARALGNKVAAAGASGVLVEAAAPSTVRVNPTVARGLGVRLPGEAELTMRVTPGRPRT